MKNSLNKTNLLLLCLSMYTHTHTHTQSSGNRQLSVWRKSKTMANSEKFQSHRLLHGWESPRRVEGKQRHLSDRWSAHSEQTAQKNRGKGGKLGTVAIFISSEQNELLKERASTTNQPEKRKPTACLKAADCQAPAESCSAPSKGHAGYWRWVGSWTLSLWPWKCHRLAARSITRELLWIAVSQTPPETYQIRNSNQQSVSTRPPSDFIYEAERREASLWACNFVVGETLLWERSPVFN